MRRKDSARGTVYQLRPAGARRAIPTIYGATADPQTEIEGLRPEFSLDTTSPAQRARRLDRRGVDTPPRHTDA